MPTPEKGQSLTVPVRHPPPNQQPRQSPRQPEQVTEHLKSSINSLSDQPPPKQPQASDKPSQPEGGLMSWTSKLFSGKPNTSPQKKQEERDGILLALHLILEILMQLIAYLCPFQLWQI